LPEGEAISQSCGLKVKQGIFIALISTCLNSPTNLAKIRYSYHIVVVIAD